MELLKVLAMPFQMASLLFVAITSGLLGLLLSLGGATMVTLVISAHAAWLMLVWLTNYALQMIDDAANGHREARTASIEMMHNPFLDARCWLHPGLAAALVITHYLQPGCRCGRRCSLPRCSSRPQSVPAPCPAWRAMR